MVNNNDSSPFFSKKVLIWACVSVVLILIALVLLWIYNPLIPVNSAHQSTLPSMASFQDTVTTMLLRS